MTNLQLLSFCYTIYLDQKFVIVPFRLPFFIFDHSSLLLSLVRYTLHTFVFTMTVVDEEKVTLLEMEEIIWLSFCVSV